MVVLSRPALENLALIKTCNPPPSHFSGIPVINLSSPNAKHFIVDACQQFGFFKLINHGVSNESITRLEVEAVKFFNLTQEEKDEAGPPNPFGYGNRRIGNNGDMGWLEYLLFNTNSEFLSERPLSTFPENSEIFRSAMKDYIEAVKNMCYKVLELVTDGLKIVPKNALSRHLRDDNSDSKFRINHYPPSLLELPSNKNYVGFGEHTDPQIISALRSNNTSGLQIALNDGTWVSVPPDPYSFFVNVGDALQAMTNGRFKSVKHRVLCDNSKSRLSMIFFGAPPLTEKILPLPSLMEEGEECLYNDFTWSEYLKSAYKTKLSDNRLRLFEREPLTI